MAQSPRERGGRAASRLIESARRLGIAKETVLDHYLFHEDSGGFRGALNAAQTAVFNGEIAVGERAEYVMGWVMVLAEALRDRL